MNVLIAVIGWVKGAVNGEHQAMRDTTLSTIGKYPGLSYKFFIGDGTPTGEDETELIKSLGESPCTYNEKAEFWSKATEKFSYTPKDDEVVLHVPDDYMHHVYKTRAAHRWGVKHGFEHTFKCDTDTYTVLERLVSSDFAQYDYSGKVGESPERGRFVSGGCGRWLSKKAAKLIVNEPVTFWAEDGWIGTIMKKHGIEAHHSDRYVDAPFFPQKDNNIISVHLSCTPEIYETKMMYEMHRQLHA